MLRARTHKREQTGMECRGQSPLEPEAGPWAQIYVDLQEWAAGRSGRKGNWCGCAYERDDFVFNKNGYNLKKKKSY